jgi:hypothetical protein
VIVLWGLPGDDSTAAVRLRLAELGRTAVLIDQRAALEQRCEIAFDDEPSGWFACGPLRIDVEGVTAFYPRPYDPLAVAEVASAGRESAQAKHALAVHEALRSWTELTPALVVNRLSANASNLSKPYQVEIIRATGFQVPETLVTTDPDAAREFVAQHGDVIYKSVSGVRSIVARLTPDKLDRLDAVSACPTQFQRRIPGVDVRAHVVGDHVHACELETRADDYRYAGRAGESVRVRHAELPPPIGDRCLALARRLDLPFAGIDLRRTPDGEWFCFEVNPSPGFDYYDLDGSLARRVAELLAAGRN